MKILGTRPSFKSVTKYRATFRALFRTLFRTPLQTHLYSNTFRRTPSDLKGSAAAAALRHSCTRRLSVRCCASVQFMNYELCKFIHFIKCLFRLFTNCSIFLRNCIMYYKHKVLEFYNVTLFTICNCIVLLYSSSKLVQRK